MSDGLSPEEKIKALFFRALEPAAQALKQEFRPSDITVTVEELPDLGPQYRRITIDLSRTPFKEYVDGLSMGAADALSGEWRHSFDNGTLTYVGSARMERVSVEALQRGMAAAALLDQEIRQRLGAAANGRSY